MVGGSIGEELALVGSEQWSHNPSLVIHFSKVSQLRSEYRETREEQQQIKLANVHLGLLISDS